MKNKCICFIIFTYYNLARAQDMALPMSQTISATTTRPPQDETVAPGTLFWDDDNVVPPSPPPTRTPEFIESVSTFIRNKKSNLDAGFDLLT